MGSTEDPSNVLGRCLKEGERIVAPTRRPDGTLRKPIRIRAGYVPQEEVAIYQSKGALLRRAMPEVPPGYDPVADSKPKSKSAKRNERKKEKKHQVVKSCSKCWLEFHPRKVAWWARYQHHAIPRKAAIASTFEKGKTSDNAVNGQTTATENKACRDEDVEAVAQQLDSLTVCTEASVAALSQKTNCENMDLDKRIRALKKKIRLTEAQQASVAGKEILIPEQSQKIAKLDTWRQELKVLEEKRMASGF